MYKCTIERQLDLNKRQQMSSQTNTIQWTKVTSKHRDGLLPLTSYKAGSFTGGSWQKSPIRITDRPPKTLSAFSGLACLSLQSTFFKRNVPTIDFSSMMRSLTFLKSLCSLLRPSPLSSGMGFLVLRFEFNFSPLILWNYKLTLRCQPLATVACCETFLLQLRKRMY